MYEIKQTNLKATSPKRPGFAGLNLGISGGTAPWSRLQRIGLAKLDSNPANYSGRLDLYIGQGGLKEIAISRYYKTMFRNDVFPAIRNFLRTVEVISSSHGLPE